jgi:hypothetical protein
MVEDMQALVQRAQARSDKARLRATVTRWLPIHGGRAFAAHFGVLDAEQMTELETQSEAASVGDRVDVAAQGIADACRGIRAYPDATNGVDLANELGPVRFDERFARLLGLELDEDSSVAVVKACWTMDDGTVNELMLDRFAQDLVLWMVNTSARLDDEVLEK